MYYFHTAHVIYSEMKNPFSIILVIAAIALFVSGQTGFFIPMIMFIVAANLNKKDKVTRRGRGRTTTTTTTTTTRGTRGQYDPYRRQKEQEARRRRNYEQQTRRPKAPPRPRKQPKARPKPNPYKTSGVAKYKDFDYDGAIEDFKKAIEINGNDIPTHFNLACAYSLTEEKDLAYKHIDLAVNLGFKDLEKIKTHDAFAYIRIQDDFAAFEENGYRLTAKMDIPQGGDGDAEVDPLLLERLQKLSELRDRGILTEQEFLVQKEKLLG